MTNPLLPPTCRNKNPNAKIHPLLKQAIFASQQAIFIGRCISIGEQTIGMQVKHKDKLRIKLKKGVDVFKCDAVCADGFTYSFVLETNHHQVITRHVIYQPCI